MSVVTIRRLLRERLADGCDDAGIPPARRNYEGDRFTTPDPIAVHVRETLIPGAERVVATDGRPVAESAGIYQVDVYAPAGAGTADLDAAVETLRARFTPGAATATPDVFLELTGAAPLAITETDRVLQCPLSITWRARRVVTTRS